MVRKFTIEIDGLPGNTKAEDIKKFLTMAIEKTVGSWMVRKLLPSWVIDIVQNMKILSVIDAP